MRKSWGGGVGPVQYSEGNLKAKKKKTQQKRNEKRTSSISGRASGGRKKTKLARSLKKTALLGRGLGKLTKKKGGQT